MKINKIDNQTNFKMSLKINPKLHQKIAERGNNFWEKLDNYGKNISDVTLYHVVLDENIQTPKIIHYKNTARDFFAELKNEEKNLGKYYEVPAGLEGDTRGGFYPDEPRVFQKLYNEKAREKYAEFIKLNVFEQAAEYSRMLQELEQQQIAAQKNKASEKLIASTQKQDSQILLNQQINSIIEKYKYEPTTHAQEVVKNKKTRWWQKIFVK